MKERHRQAPPRQYVHRSGPRSSITGEEWQTHRPVITRLYLTENRPLKDVQQIMESVFGFHATKRMYMGKIKAWDICKHYKAAEKEELSTVIADARRKNIPMDSISFRGEPVRFHRVTRYLKTKGRQTSKYEGVRHTDFLTPSTPPYQPENQSGQETMRSSTGISTPRSRLTPTSSVESHAGSHTNSPPEAAVTQSEVESSALAHRPVVLPIPRPVATVSGLLNLELLLKRIQHSVSYTPEVASEPIPSVRFWSSIRSGVYFLKVGSPHLAWPVLNEACANASELLASAVSSLSVPFIRGLLSTLAPANNRFHPEVRGMLLEYLSKLFSESLHPLSIICSHLFHASLEDETSQRGLNLLLDLTQSPTRELRCVSETVATHMALISVYRRLADLAAAETTAKLLIAYCDVTFGPWSPESCDAKIELVYIYTAQARYDEGLMLCQEVLDARSVALGATYPDKKACYAMENIAEMYHFRGQEGDIDMCITWLRKALENTWRLRGGVQTTIHIRDKLWGMLVTLGRVSEAEELEVTYSAEPPRPMAKASDM